MKITRDKTSNAIVNQDEEGYLQARARKQMQKRRMKLEQENKSLRQYANSLEERIAKLESIILNK